MRCRGGRRVRETKCESKHVMLSLVASCRAAALIQVSGQGAFKRRQGGALNNLLGRGDASG